MFGALGLLVCSLQLIWVLRCSAAQACPQQHREFAELNKKGPFCCIMVFSVALFGLRPVPWEPAAASQLVQGEGFVNDVNDLLMNRMDDGVSCWFLGRGGMR